MRGSAMASSSSTAPVPSGELSSTNRTSASGPVSKRATIARTLSRSLYVGTTISACGMAGADHSDPSCAPQRAMLAMVRSRRAWSTRCRSLVVPAGGIAYLDAVSYRDVRGATTTFERSRVDRGPGLARSWPMVAVSIDGVVVDPERASISVFDRGLLYGDGCFEVLRTWDHVARDLDAHLDRLLETAAFLQLKAMERPRLV